MCGISGSWDEEKISELVDALEHRGQSCKNLETDSFFLGHVLHSVVGELEQPISNKGILAANCEIYNWKELNEKYGWSTENDAETLLKLLDEKGSQGLEEVDGIYSFAYIKDGKLMIARDRLGVNPVWYVESSEDFAFASEKQALEKAGYNDIRELHPRQILHYDLEEKKISFEQREFFELNVPKNSKSSSENQKTRGEF